MGFIKKSLRYKTCYTRNTLAKANELRNWRIYADFARVFVDIARKFFFVYTL